MPNWIKPNSGNGDWDDEVQWKPNEAAELFGTVVSKTTVETQYGPTVVLKIEDAGGVVNTVWCSRGGLKKVIEENDDQIFPGRSVGLRTTGKTKLKDGRDFFPYEICFPDDDAPHASVPSMPISDDPF